MHAEGAKDVTLDLVATFRRNQLATWASAISFQVLFAVVPLLLASLALLSFLNLSEVWRSDIAPEVRERTSAAGFTVIDETVTRILATKRAFWLTLGAALALFELSGAVRAVMGALDAIYGRGRRRTFLARMALSLALAVPLALLILGAAAALRLPRLVAHGLDGGALVTVGSNVAGWLLAVLLLAAAVWLVIRYAPSSQQPASFTSLATILVVGIWLLASVAFGFFATTVASYGSVYGSLAVAMIVMTYLYISSLAFLTGVQLDAYVRALGDRTQAREPGPS